MQRKMFVNEIYIMMNMHGLNILYYIILSNAIKIHIKMYCSYDWIEHLNIIIRFSLLTCLIVGFNCILIIFKTFFKSYFFF